MTVLDIGATLILAVNWNVSLMLVDAVAVAFATAVSYWLHRLISYSAEPARRWFRDIPHYLMGAVTAGAADVALFGILTAGVSSRTAAALFVPKCLSILGAFLVRIAFYRDAMFRSVRSDQMEPARRPLEDTGVRLSLVIPAFGEGDGIGSALAQVEESLGHLRTDGGLEVIVVDDGSDDDTAAAAERGGADVVLRHEVNRGKGAAVRSGMLVARGATVAFTDADLSYSPDQVERLMDAIEDGWDVVVGSRRHTETTTLVAAGRLREVGGRVINAFTSLRAAGSVPRHPVRAEGVSWGRRPPDLRPVEDRRLRLRRRGVPPRGAFPPHAGRRSRRAAPTPVARPFTSSPMPSVSWPISSGYGPTPTVATTSSPMPKRKGGGDRASSLMATIGAVTPRRRPEGRRTPTGSIVDRCTTSTTSSRHTTFGASSPTSSIPRTPGPSVRRSVSSSGTEDHDVVAGTRRTRHATVGRGHDRGLRRRSVRRRASTSSTSVWPRPIWCTSPRVTRRTGGDVHRLAQSRSVQRHQVLPVGSAARR